MAKTVALKNAGLCQDSVSFACLGVSEANKKCLDSPVGYLHEI
jgi:hypothetical protein